MCYTPSPEPFRIHMIHIVMYTFLAHQKNISFLLLSSFLKMDKTENTFINPRFLYKKCKGFLKAMLKPSIDYIQFAHQCTLNFRFISFIFLIIDPFLVFFL
jgi:hypothetical protein